MNLKRILAFFISAFLILNIVGCNNTGDNTSSEAEHLVENKHQKNYMTLLYSMSDSFNPYAVKTAINRQLCQLIYEPLVKLAGAGATTPLTGFGYAISRGVRDAVTQRGLLGVLGGGLSSCAAVISAVLVMSLVAALISKKRPK
jgi:hypothetical protein